MDEPVPPCWAPPREGETEYGNVMITTILSYGMSRLPRQNHVAISPNVLPPPQVTLPRPFVCCLYTASSAAAQPLVCPSSNKPGLTVFHQHFGNQRGAL